MVLTAIIVMLAGLIICSSIGTVETSYPVAADVKAGEASIVLDKDTEYTVKEGMTLRVAGEDITIENVRRLDSGETVVTAEVSLQDGTYDAKIVTERITPITFLLN